MTLNITAASLALFLDYARDAGNWGSTVLVGGNVGGTKEDCGNLTQLKKAGLIRTFADEGTGRYRKEVWLVFTAEGKALAAEHGIKV